MPAWRHINRVILTVAVAVLTLGTDALFSQSRHPNARRIVVLDGREVVEGEVIVRYRSRSGQLERVRAEFQADSDTSEAIGQRGSRRMRSRSMTTRQMLATLRANPDVEFVEPNYVIRASALPNDPSFPQLWGLRNTGQTVDGQAGVPDADIHATQAWDVTTGSRANIVAVLDTGVDFGHPDLAPNLFSAPRQFSMTIGSVTVTCGEGTHGFNAITNLCVPFDDNGHGTHIAGIIGAVGNNNVGVTGVNWTANIMALKVLGADGTGSTSDAIKAIDFVIKAKQQLGADANVRILNASWGGPTFSQALDDEIQTANNSDLLFVAAAGTDGRNTDVTPHYPASSTKSNVISVAAVDNTGQLADFSNYGATSVDLAAPGSSTLSTLPNNTYGELSGTSMAAPFVSGAAALVLSVCPANTPALKSVLLSTVDPVTSLSGKSVSGGRLNVDRAVRTCLSSVTTMTATAQVNPGAAITINVTNAKARNDWVGLFTPGAADSQYSSWVYLNGTQTAPATTLTNATFQMTAPSTTGNYELRLFSGSKVASAPVTVSTQQQAGLSINDVSVVEGNSGTSSMTFTVTLTPVNNSQTVTVNYATSNGTATTADNDYTATSGTLTFPPSTATRTIVVPVIGDTRNEANETVTMTLSSPSNAAIADGQGIGTITNDDSAGTPAISATANVAPGGTITVNVSNGNAPNNWVGLYTAGAADNAYITWQYLNGQQTTPTATIPNATLQFTAPSTAGNYEVRLFAPSRVGTAAVVVGGQQQQQSTISINDVSVAEGNSGTASATFTVTLSPVNNAQTVTVAFATANGSATTGDNDYGAVSGTVTFPPSSGTQTIIVPVIGDTRVEGDETFTVNLSSPTNAVIGDGQGIGTITNDDSSGGGGGAPAITATASVNPGGTITVTVSNATGANNWVGLYAVGAGDGAYLDWQYLNGTKTAPASTITNATLQFTAPSTTGNYEVRFYNQSRSATAPVTVTTQQQQPALRINDVSIAEGNSGATTATFTVTLSPVNNASTVTVAYATADGTATIAGNDYVSASGTLTFSPSVASQTIQISINGDTAVESNETFFINLSNATNATIGDAQGIGTITNDDSSGGGGGGAPALTATASVAPGGVINVTVSNATGANNWVGLYAAGAGDGAYLDWQYLNGTKTAPASTIANATLQFTAPSTTGNYEVRFYNQSRSATAPVTVTTQPTGPTLSVNDITVTEGNSGTSTATFTVTLSPANSAQTVTVNYVTVNGTATSGSDYNATSGTLTFTPSTTTQTVQVSVIGDTTGEGAETFMLNLSGAVNATIGDGTGVATITNDDAATTTSIVVNTPSVTAGQPISFTVNDLTPNPTDWVGLFPAGAADNGYTNWTYLNGSKTAPGSGISSANLQLTPTASGTYELRLFYNNGYTRLATSTTITVTP